MFGTIWMFSDQIDDEDLLFAQRSFITISMAIDYYGMSYKAVTHAMDRAGAVYKPVGQMNAADVIEEEQEKKSILKKLQEDACEMAKPKPVASCCVCNALECF